MHFLLLGAGIYLAYGWFDPGDSAEDDNTIVVTADEIASLSDQWARLWRRPPTEQELEGVIGDWVRTRVLYQEALAMGLDNGDLVIERRLAQKLELLARGLITPAEPDDDVLRAWYEQNISDFTAPDLYTISQVFFDPARREAAMLDDAAAALVELRALGTVPESLASFGDSFLMLDGYYPSRTELDLTRAFGSVFSEEVIELPPGEWHGPLLSGYGMHLVYVHDIVRAVSPEFESIRDTILSAWTAEQVETLSERFIADIVARYDVVIEEADVTLSQPRQDASRP